MARVSPTVHGLATASLFLLVIATSTLVVRTETLAWFWNKGCYKWNSSDLIFNNITNNSPSACLQTCDNETQTIALQDNKCACNVDVSGKRKNPPYTCPNICSGSDINFCGGPENESMWSVYTKAEDQELSDRRINLNETGCVSVKQDSGKQELQYTVLPCNDSSVLHLCQGFSGCKIGHYHPAPNWTFSCGWEISGSFLRAKYYDDFNKMEKCVLSETGTYDLWTGLFSHKLKDTESSLTTEPTSFTSTIDITTTIEPTLLPSSESTDTSSSTISTDSYASSTLTESLSIATNFTPDYKRSTETTVTNDASKSTISVTGATAHENSTAIYKTTGIRPSIVSHPSTTEALNTITPLYSTEKLSSTSISLMVVGSVLILLAVAFVAVVSARKRAANRSSLNVDHLSDFTQSDGRSTVALTLRSLPRGYQDERSRQIISSVDMGNINEDFPQLSGSLKADLRMNGSSTFVTGDCVIENGSSTFMTNDRLDENNVLY
ncbi:hypothetical protein ACF0H5_012412 [Mactra antiquata]